MGRQRRINVSSGRPLEHLAHYSRALRVGNMVLQSGTTAIDTDGNVIGAGDVAAQVDAIFGIAEDSMGKAGGRLEDVVLTRIYFTDAAVAEDAARAIGRRFREIRPASTLVMVNRLARPAQLIEIEFDAIDGASITAQRISSGRPSEELYGYSRAVRVGDRVFVSGSTAMTADGAVAHPGDMYGQTRDTFETIEEALSEAGAALDDVVYTKTFLTDLSMTADQRRAKLELFDDIRPTGTLLGIPALMMPDMLIEFEVEAIVGAAATRRDIHTSLGREKALGFARAVEVGGCVYVSGCTAIDDAGSMRAAGDWAAQFDLCHEGIEAALADAGAVMDDIVRKRTFTLNSAEQNRPYGEGPAWCADSRPTSLGCRIDALAHPGMLVEVEAMAVKGAHADIEWLGPED